MHAKFVVSLRLSLPTLTCKEMLEKPKRQSGMQNSETLATLGTQDTERRQTKQNKQHRKLKR